jgi:uncharacterized membrane protein YwaF
MTNIVDPVDFFTTTLLIILHVVLLVVAIRVYVTKRTRAAGLLLLACIAYTLARFAWFSYDLAIEIASLPIPKSKSPSLRPWSFYSIRFFHIAFMLLIILALRAIRRGTSDHLTNRSSQPLIGE